MGLTGSKAISKGDTHVTLPPLDRKSKCGIVAFAIIGVAGGALLCLGSISFFGPVGSFNFIATVSTGSAAVLIGTGGITYLVVRDRKPVPKSEVRSQKSEVEKRESSPPPLPPSPVSDAVDQTLSVGSTFSPPSKNEPSIFPPPAPVLTAGQSPTPLPDLTSEVLSRPSSPEKPPCSDAPETGTLSVPISVPETSAPLTHLSSIRVPSPSGSPEQLPSPPPTTVLLPGAKVGGRLPFTRTPTTAFDADLTDLIGSPSTGSPATAFPQTPGGAHLDPSSVFASPSPETPSTVSSPPDHEALKRSRQAVRQALRDRQRGRQRHPITRLQPSVDAAQSASAATEAASSPAPAPVLPPPAVAPAIPLIQPPPAAASAPAQLLPILPPILSPAVEPAAPPSQRPATPPPRAPSPKPAPVSSPPVGPSAVRAPSPAPQPPPQVAPPTAQPLSPPPSAPAAFVPPPPTAAPTAILPPTGPLPTAEPPTVMPPLPPAALPPPTAAPAAPFIPPVASAKPAAPQPKAIPPLSAEAQATIAYALSLIPADLQPERLVGGSSGKGPVNTNIAKLMALMTIYGAKFENALKKYTDPWLRKDVSSYLNGKYTEGRIGQDQNYVPWVDAGIVSEVETHFTTNLGVDASKDPWKQKDVLDAMNDYFAIAFAIGMLTLDDLPAFAEKMPDRKTLEQIIARQDAYVYQTFYKLPFTYHCNIRSRLVYDSSDDRFINNLDSTYVMYLPKHYLEALNTPGNILNTWRTLYNEFCQRVNEYVDLVKLETFEDRAVKWSRPDDGTMDFNAMPSPVPS